MRVKVSVQGQSLRWYGNPPEIADSSVEFVEFQFLLPPEWEDCEVVAQFGQTETYNVALVNNCCFLPVEIKAGSCSLSLFGQKAGKNIRATSIPLRFRVKNSGFTPSGETPIPPTPDLYAQLLEQVKQYISEIPQFEIRVVPSLPEVGEEKVLYLIPLATAEGNYLEYLWINGSWEVLGSQKIDLSKYAEKDWVVKNYQPIGDYAKKGDLPKKAEDVGADPSGTAKAAVEDHNSSLNSHEDLRKQIRDLRADIEYVKITVESFVADSGTQELGSTLESVGLSWRLNKAPTKQSINGVEASPDLRSKKVSGPFTETTKFTLSVMDERDAKSSASVTVPFLNGIYWGALPLNGPIDSEALLQLTKKLQGNRGTTFTVNAGGMRPVFACPVRYGTPKFVIGGFEYSWTKIGSGILFTNASGHTEAYDVWQHGQNVSGSITVTVS